MRIGLIDVDGHNFPNLALMKISSYWKNQNHAVEWYNPDAAKYDTVYMAKVFSDAYSPDYTEPVNADFVVRGGQVIVSLLKTAKSFITPKEIYVYLTGLNILIQIILFIQNTQDTVNL